MFSFSRRDSSKRNVIFTFLYCCFTFFFFMYIWSSFFYLFRTFTFKRLLTAVFCAIVYIYAERVAFSLETSDSQEVHKTFHVLIAAEICNEISRNLAGFLHVPGPMLKDVGFMLIKEVHNKFLERLGDMLTIIPFVVLILVALSMDAKSFAKFMTDQLRIFSLYYFTRSFCIWVTLLPGPAPHCRPGGAFNPPQDWVDVIAHMPVDGISFMSCGDLVPSGHIGFVTLALVAIVRVLPRTWIAYRKQIIGFCVFYLLLTGFFIIASRKHYTVDLVVGFFLSFLLSFVFKDGWIPHGSLIESPYEVLQIESAV